MSLWIWGLTAVLGGACLVKVGQWWLSVRISAEITIPRPGPDAGPPSFPHDSAETATKPGHGWPSVLVVIPARNEERDLPPCLEAVLAQDYPNFSVLVVDDRSEDRTATIVGEYLARDSRIRLEQVTALPPGWTGKAHAMWFAAQGATADWLQFIDADVTLEPWAVRGAMQEALARRVALLTAFPRAAREGFWQQVSLPLLGSLLMLWYRPDWVNNPVNPMGFVNGQFLLMRRDEYQRVGGHWSVRDTLIEDVPFGGVAKRAGVACRLALCGNLAKIRMYTSFQGLVDGFPRIYIGALRSRAKLALTALVLMMNLASLAILLVLGFLAVAGSPPWQSGATATGLAPPLEWTALVAVCVADIGVSLLLYAQLWRGGQLSAWWVWLYPLALTLAIVILIRAWWWLTTGHIVTWRGTGYQIDRRGRILPQVAVNR